MEKLMRNFRKPILVALVILLILTLSPVVASAKTERNTESKAPVTFEDTIEVTANGGNFKVGFAKIKFFKDCLDDEDLPLLIDVEIYAENGTVYIEFTPDVDAFNRPVFILSKLYKGYIYDKATGENIYVEIPPQGIWVNHFSRYCFVF